MSEIPNGLSEQDIGFKIPNLPGDALPDYLLWKAEINQNNPTKEIGVKTPNGEYYTFDHGEELLMVKAENGIREPYIRLEDGQEISFQSWRLLRKQEIAGILERVDSDYRTAYLLAIEGYPQLEQMQVKSATSREYPVLQYTGGFWERPEKPESPPGIVVNMDENLHYGKLLVDREISAKKSAEVIGIDFNQMKQNPNILKLFIFLHEIGHVEDYITNYSNKANDNKHNPLERSLEDRKKQMDSLPVPGVSPVQTRQMYDNGELDKYFQKYQQYYNQNGIKSPEELLAAQEIAYHGLPSEVYADQFAAKIMKENWNTLIKPR